MTRVDGSLPRVRLGASGLDGARELLAGGLLQALLGEPSARAPGDCGDSSFLGVEQAHPPRSCVHKRVLELRLLRWEGRATGRLRLGLCAQLRLRTAVWQLLRACSRSEPLLSQSSRDFGWAE